MYVFQRNDETVFISASEIQLNLHITIKKLDTSWVAKVPSLNTVAYIDKEENIETTVNSSVESFFKYWTKVQGQAAFFEHMQQLGFTITRSRKPDGTIIPHYSPEEIAMTLAV